MAQSEDGKLFGWGHSADGRLGQVGKAFEVSKSPLNSIADIELSNLKLEVAEKMVLKAIEEEKDMPIIWDPTLIEEVNVIIFLLKGLAYNNQLQKETAFSSSF